MSDPADDREAFEEQYGSVRSQGARLVERRALGHDIGSNGYTTVHAARVLIERLRLHAPRFLLDLGSGRAWPGAMVGEELGCRLVASDIPRNALVDARAVMRSRGVAGDVAAADGCWLPFRSASFDGLIHSDVFC